MSSLAKYLLNKGCIITGSDIYKNEETLKLKNNGIKIFFQHKYENIVGADLVVYNSAIKNDNIELLLAKE